ncbi:sensor histidine kinase [Rathayibacter soli]|uniref:sensor histidine kinase n=1 Tax=Rathayibacter soli TaxID=3144168 RepID=UPI0027E4320A|nr:sensor histidine kinase [Glaciibacter superstes]
MNNSAPIHSAQFHSAQIHSALTPVFTALRVGLHILFVGLTLFVVVHAMLTGAAAGASSTIAVIVLGLALLVVYGSASFFHLSTSKLLWPIWLVVLVVLCLSLMALTADAAYLVFPLFFLLLHLIRQPWNVIAVAALTACAIIALAWHIALSVSVVVGPIIGAAVAVAIGVGYQALYREAREREALIRDLVATREQLAATEREAGVLAERARLAREIHDTVAQGLSSIQLLLHAVERADEHHPAIDHVRLARETAATNLAETRRFIRELTPPALEEQTLEGALRRLASRTTETAGLPIHVTISGDPISLPMDVETALLRIAQGSLANVTQHARASQVELTLSYMDDSVSIDIVDDGQGFDPTALPAHPGSTHESFGLRAIRGRAEQLGGYVVIESRPGSGTAVAVSLPLPEHDDSTMRSEEP